MPKLFHIQSLDTLSSIQTGTSQTLSCMHSIIWCKNNYFLFDSHSDGNGCFVAEGNSVFLMFRERRQKISKDLGRNLVGPQKLYPPNH